MIKKKSEWKKGSHPNKGRRHFLIRRERKKEKKKKRRHVLQAHFSNPVPIPFLSSFPQWRPYPTKPAPPSTLAEENFTIS